MYKSFILLLLGTFLQAEIYDGISIIVADKVITLLDIKKEMKAARVDAKTASDILVRQKLEEFESQQRQIEVTSSEVYEEIKNMAKGNKLSVSDFYNAVMQNNGLSSQELKAKLKQKLMSQKLYSAISYAYSSTPTDDEIEEYYKINQARYKHPDSFDVVVYNCQDKKKIEQKVHNPMFYAPDVQTQETTLEYGKIPPKLAKLLQSTPLNTCTATVPDGKGGYVSFYVKGMKDGEEPKLEDIKDEIMRAMNAKKRDQILDDYFARLRHNTSINIIREVD